MVVLLFTAIAVVGLLVLAVYLWAPLAKNSEERLLPPPEPPRSFFAESVVEQTALLSDEAGNVDKEAQRNSLLERGAAGDKSALNDAHALGDKNFYGQLVDRFIQSADRHALLFALVSYVTRHELPVTNQLAEAFIKSWEDAPGRSSTATSLHLAALTDDPRLYQTTVEKALSSWRQGLLSDISATELKSIFDGEFWPLSAQTRNSGAGFLLKHRLATARRELENAKR